MNVGKNGDKTNMPRTPWRIGCVTEEETYGYIVTE